MPKPTKTKEQFIKESEEKHNFKFDYSKVEYVSSKLKVIIGCPIHGDFEQVAGVHTRGHGCNQCKGRKTVETHKYTTEEFKNKAVIKHINRYDYSLTEYKNSKKKVKIICKIHGIFEQRPHAHLKGHGCVKCKGEKTTIDNSSNTEDFIEKAIVKHNNYYNYPDVQYTNNRTPVKINCPIHGDFKQKPNAHLNGQGCTKCGKESHWSRCEYIKKAKNRKCTFYTLRCFNDQEEFYKIGITVNEIKQRYCSKKSMPYQYEVIKEIVGEVDEIWDLELLEKRKLKRFYYQPYIPFYGSRTECFSKYIID